MNFKNLFGGLNANDRPTAVATTIEVEERPASTTRQMVVSVSPVTPPADPVVPEAEDVLAAMDANEFAAYRRTANAVGFEPTALVEAEVLAFMAEQKIRRYPLEKVAKYLRFRAKKDGGPYTVWGWKALRSVDAVESVKGSEQAWFDRGNVYIPPTILTHGGAIAGQYEHAIPLRVLGRVEQFVQQFGDKVKFLVSDYAVQRPDPFIAVVPSRGVHEPIVFDVWDEPDFK